MVTSYTLFRLEADDYVAQRWGGLMLDEAQFVKNHTGKTYQSRAPARRTVPAGAHRHADGEPPDRAVVAARRSWRRGCSRRPRRFTEQYANPIERLGDTEVLDRFRRRIRPFLLRRTKELVAADLPPKQEQVLRGRRSTPRHRKVYETHLQRERQKVLGLVEDDFDKHRIAIFRSLTRLRQLSLDAALVDDGLRRDRRPRSSTCSSTSSTSCVAEGHRALMFSQFTSFLSAGARRGSTARGSRTAYLDGRTRGRGRGDRRVQGRATRRCS